MDIVEDADAVAELIEELRCHELRIQQGANEACGKAANALEFYRAQIEHLRGELATRDE